MKARYLALLLLAALAACERSPTSPTTRLRVGETITLNAQARKTCEDPIQRTGRVVAVTERAVVIADTANPAGGFTDAEYEAIGRAFDTQVYPLGVRNFGEPSDIDRNGRVVLFYTRAVNELTATGAGSVVTGFFFSRDLFPRSSRGGSTCATSNEAEILYMLVPDPTGVAGDRRSKESVQRTTVAVLAHEFQHLINAGRRMYVARAEVFEEVWLNEGLSHIAEELMFYQESGLSPRQNLTMDRIRGSAGALNAYTGHQSQNVERLIRYYQRPDTASVMGPDNLATRGAAWSFLRYGADRRGGSETALWQALVNTTTAGVANLRSALGAEPLAWMHDWTVASYADDLVAGVDARWSMPSWNFRSVMPDPTTTGTVFPLRVVTLQDRRPESVTLPRGGAAYFRLRVAPLGLAEVRADGGSGACQPGGPVLRLQVGEVHTASGPAAAALCLDGGGGAQSAEFAYIPFFASEATANLPLTVVASGILAAGVAVQLSPDAHAPPAARPGEIVTDREWEIRLREMEVRELTPKLGGATRSLQPTGPLTQAAASELLRVAVVRTR
jgi:hypothetical protein